MRQTYTWRRHDHHCHHHCMKNRNPMLSFPLTASELQCGCMCMLECLCMNGWPSLLLLWLCAYGNDADCSTCQLVRSWTIDLQYIWSINPFARMNILYNERNVYGKGAYKLPLIHTNPHGLRIKKNKKLTILPLFSCNWNIVHSIFAVIYIERI